THPGSRRAASRRSRYSRTWPGVQVDSSGPNSRCASTHTRLSASSMRSAGAVTVAMSGHLLEGLPLRPGEESGGDLGEVCDRFRAGLGDGDRDRLVGVADDQAGLLPAVVTTVELGADGPVVQVDGDPAVDVGAHAVPPAALRRACFLRLAADERRGRPVGLRPTRGS